MDAQVTEEMVTAAGRELPGVWNRERIRRALVAGIAAMPAQQTIIPVPAQLEVHLLVDETQLRAAALAAAEHARQLLPVDAKGFLDLAELRLPLQPVAEIPEPQRSPVLEQPRELGSLADIARRLEVARSTVTGWVKNRETNRMPAPVDGDVYDLPAVEAWYREWKGLDDAA